MDYTTVQTLFRQFVAPLAEYAATSPERKGLAEMLARNLWTAMIAGPEIEEVMWNVLKTTGKLDDDSLQIIQQMYFDQMKPVVSEKERATLHELFRFKWNNQT